METEYQGKSQIYYYMRRVLKIWSRENIQVIAIYVHWKTIK